MSRSLLPIPSASSVNDRLQGFLSLFLLCKCRVSLPFVMNHDYIYTCRVLPSLRFPSRRLLYPDRRVSFHSSRQFSRLVAVIVGYHQTKMVRPAKTIKPVVVKKIRSGCAQENEALFLCLAVAVVSAGTVTVAAAAEAE